MPTIAQFICLHGLTSAEHAKRALKLTATLKQEAKDFLQYTLNKDGAQAQLVTEALEQIYTEAAAPEHANKDTFNTCPAYTVFCALIEDHCKRPALLGPPLLEKQLDFEMTYYCTRLKRDRTLHLSKATYHQNGAYTLTAVRNQEKCMLILSQSGEIHGTLKGAGYFSSIETGLALTSPHIFELAGLGESPFKDYLLASTDGYHNFATGVIRQDEQIIIKGKNCSGEERIAEIDISTGQVTTWPMGFVQAHLYKEFKKIAAHFKQSELTSLLEGKRLPFFMPRAQGENVIIDNLECINDLYHFTYRLGKFDANQPVNTVILNKNLKPISGIDEETFQTITQDELPKIMQHFGIPEPITEPAPCLS